MFKPYKYTKKTKIDYRTLAEDFFVNHVSAVKSIKITLRLGISVTLLTVGLYLMSSKVILPVASIYAASQTQYPIISPIASNSPVLSARDPNAFSFSELDYAYRSDEGSVAQERSYEDYPDQFYLTIPKLNIYDAIVSTNSSNLDPRKALGHYKGSCLPDESCNVFIFGHSTNKWVKNHYESGDYTSVFSHLDELQYGDEIFVKYKDKEYRYMVDLWTVRNPEDVDPLSQPYPKSSGLHQSTIELFTCTPSGTTKYRLSVVAKLVQ